MQAIVDACFAGEIKAEPALVISNNSQSKALERAHAANIPTAHISSATHPNPTELDDAILSTLLAHNIDLVILAGYMKKLGPRTIERFSNRILNIHPGLLPQYGGAGYYGIRVHQAVIEAGEKETGVTVHLVDEEYDHGATLAVVRVPILKEDSPETLQQRVLIEEHRIYVDTVRRIAEGTSIEVLIEDAKAK